LNSSSPGPSSPGVIDFIPLCIHWQETRALTTVDSSSDDRENSAPPLSFITFIVLLLLFHPRRSGIMKSWRIDDGLREKRKDKKEKYTFTKNLI